MEMSQLIQKIKEARPNLSDTSIKSYKSILSSLFRQIHGNITEFDATLLESRQTAILDHLKDLEPSRRKTRLSALVVAVSAMDPDSKAVDGYRRLMMEDAAKCSAQDRLQKRSEKQQENWLDWDEIQDFWEQSKKDTMPLWNKPRLSKDEFGILQDFVILSVYVLVPPRRILDYTSMRVRNADRQQDNYMDKKVLVFHEFKTKKFYNTQRVEMPSSLQTIVKKWMKVNLESDYLIVDTQGQPMSQSQLTMRLNKIFAPTGKKISVNMLRHSYLTFQLKDMPSLVKLEKQAEDMGHSIEEALLYVKK